VIFSTNMSRKEQGVRVSYAQAVYGKEEIAAVVRVLSNPSKIAPGASVAEFEKKIAKLFGKRAGVMTNSGSSANLLAIESLKLPRGSEVITPVLTFSTTVAPLVQKGLIPVFVDVGEGTYQIDVNQIEKAISKKTRALIIPSLLGNIPDLERIQRIAKKHNLFFIEDSCDVLGAAFAGKPTGKYSHISTTSFYATHAITAAAAGGMVCVNDPALERRVRIMAAWGRNSTLFGAYEKSEDIKKRFAGKIDGKTYDAKFIFSEVGYNLQPSELNAAFALEQLKRLKKFTRTRNRRFKELYAFFKRHERFFILPRALKKAKTSFMSFPITIKPHAPFTRVEITKYLEEANVQTRPIFTGTITRQPAYKNVLHRKATSSFPVSDYIMRHGFLLGAHQGMTTVQMSYLKKTLATFLKKYS